MGTRHWIFALMLSTGAALGATAGAAHAQDAKPAAPPAPPAPAAPAAPAPPAPAPPKEAAAASAEVKAGTGVEKHEIVGESSTFAPGTTVWIWSRITNGQGTVKHVWKLDGKEVWTATLPVNSARWSTMSRRPVHAKGAYDVDVQTDGGVTIGSVSFKVE
jgi:nucleoid-associated protein YgaU